jgi:hypothetical protein
MQWATCPLAMCNVFYSGPYQILWSKQAYTSQIAAMTMMALALGEDTLSSCSRREAIIEDLFDLPSNAFKPTFPPCHPVVICCFSIHSFPFVPAIKGDEGVDLSLYQLFGIPCMLSRVFHVVYALCVL